MVTALALGICASGWLVYHNWSTRHMRVFRPIAGLSYESPPVVDDIIVNDIAIPLSFQKLSPDDAFRFNASVPVSTDPITPSRPFQLPLNLPAGDAARALDCLTAAVYYEAGSESTLGQQAVAQVVLNRMRHPAFPRSVCGVVFSGSTRATGCQFTFTCDGSLARLPAPGAWQRARRVAQASLAGYVAREVGQATHYHTLWVAPYWSPSLVKVANIGAHTFYRWQGAVGSPGAFSQPYSGQEPETPLTPGESAPADTLASTDPTPPPVIAVAPSPDPITVIPEKRPSPPALTSAAAEGSRSNDIGIPAPSSALPPPQRQPQARRRLAIPQ
jgi:spore germination cell wall hydrolase CwlJ-like protein